MNDDKLASRTIGPDSAAKEQAARRALRDGLAKIADRIRIHEPAIAKQFLVFSTELLQENEDLRLLRSSSVTLADGVETLLRIAEILGVEDDDSITESARSWRARAERAERALREHGIMMPPDQPAPADPVRDMLSTITGGGVRITFREYPPCPECRERRLAHIGDDRFLCMACRHESTIDLDAYTKSRSENPTEEDLAAFDRVVPRHLSSMERLDIVLAALDASAHGRIVLLSYEHYRWLFKVAHRAVLKDRAE